MTDSHRQAIERLELAARVYFECTDPNALSPAEAERIAAERGFLPFAVVFETADELFAKPWWPIALATLWVAYRDQDALPRAWADVVVWRRRVWLNAPHEAQAMTLRDAETALWNALAGDTVRGVGTTSDGRAPVPIAELAWLALEIVPSGLWADVRRRGEAEVAYCDVMVERDGLLDTFAEVRSAGPAQAMNAPTKMNVAPADLAKYLASLSGEGAIKRNETFDRARAHFFDRHIPERMWRLAWGGVPNKRLRGETDNVLAKTSRRRAPTS